MAPVADAEQYAALEKLRETLVSGAAKNGYDNALWPIPATVANREAAHILNQAIKAQNDVRFHYWKPDETEPVANYHKVSGTPLELVALNHPLLHLDNGKGIRTYRLDRISNLEILPARHNKKTLNTARAKVRRESISFHGGTAYLECTPDAAWITDSYPEVRIIAKNDSDQLAASEFPASLSQNASANIQIELKYNNLSSLLSILIRLGASVVHIAPQELAAKLAERAEKLLRSYQDA
ncbi:WYL domain-containing protein [Arcanobacterium hippocoleae]